LREARDWLRRHYRGSIKINVYGRDSELARQQGEAIRDFLTDSMQLDKSFIKVRGHGVESDQYMRTEITGS
jgi:hypothetical protein